MGMFDNYTKKSKDIPSNIYKYIVLPERNFIITNGNCYNTFKLLFKYDDELVHDVSVTYYQVEGVNLTKTDLEVAKFEDYFILTCHLSPEETKLFANTNLDTYAQVRLVYGDKVLYGAKLKIDVVETIVGETK